MKKIYEKPVMAKVAALPKATAQRYPFSGYYPPHCDSLSLTVECD
jgi:hypothetical protein